MTSNGFEVADVVEWTSQAQGCTKTKVGFVVEVVPPRSLPSREKFKSLYTGAGVGSPRKVKSYVVQVKTGKTAVTNYWPLPQKLRLHSGCKDED